MPKMTGACCLSRSMDAVLAITGSAPLDSTTGLFADERWGDFVHGPRGAQGTSAFDKPMSLA